MRLFLPQIEIALQTHASVLVWAPAEHNIMLF